jgi:hypothetical protein
LYITAHGGFSFTCLFFCLPVAPDENEIELGRTSCGSSRRHINVANTISDVAFWDSCLSRIAFQKLGGQTSKLARCHHPDSCLRVGLPYEADSQKPTRFDYFPELSN